MIAMLTAPHEREILMANVDYAKQQHWLDNVDKVVYVRSVTALAATHAQVLVVRYNLLHDPQVVAWRQARPTHRLLLLWPHYPHPQEVLTTMTGVEGVWMMAVYEDLRQRAFWERLTVTRPAALLVAECAQRLLAGRAAWHPEAADILHRLVSQLQSSSVQQIAAMLYSGSDPVHTVRRRLRAVGHAPPKALLLVSQLAAWRYAVSAGAGELDAARAVGRYSVESWRRSAREALQSSFPAYSEGRVPATWYVDRATAFLQAHSGDPLARTPVPTLFAPPLAA